MNKSNPIVFLLTLGSILSMFLFYACNNQVVFEKNKKIDTQGWHYLEKVDFEFESQDTSALYNIYLNVRNNRDYPYRNFIVFFQTHFPDGRIFTDTIEANLARRSGQWTGEGFGNIKSNSFHFRRDVWFPEKGNYKFFIQHAMRNEYLPGITHIGIRIEEK
ncbi:MAG: gliding motility lipoprotein GldH [Bacteroidota bacterium]